MKIFIKISMGFLVMFFWIAGLLFFDFCSHSHQRNSYQPFYPGFLMSTFLRHYIGLDPDSVHEDFMRLGSCHHIRSIEGGVYNSEEIVQDNSSWLNERNDYWLKDSYAKEKPKIFSISGPWSRDKGEDINFTIKNYTPHDDDVSFEKLENRNWKKVDISIDLVNRIHTGKKDTIEVRFFDKNKKEKTLSYSGGIQNYFIAGKTLETGDYRLVAYLDDHRPFFVYFKIQEKDLLEWTITEEQLLKNDSFNFNIINTSGETFYYSTYGAPYNARLNISKFRYQNGRKYPLPSSTFGCGSTSFFGRCILDETIRISYDSSPLFNNYLFESEDFPNSVKERYGDSVGITFCLWRYPSHLSKNRTYNVYSKEYIINTDELIANWKKKNNSL